MKTTFLSVLTILVALVSVFAETEFLRGSADRHLSYGGGHGYHGYHKHYKHYPFHGYVSSATCKGGGSGCSYYPFKPKAYGFRPHKFGYRLKHNPYYPKH